MNFSTQAALLIILPILSLGVYFLLKKYVLFKFNFKKRYLITALIIVISAPIIMAIINPKFLLPQWLYLIQMVVFTVIFLLYIDVLKRDKLIKKKRLDPVGKPKPKPNRVKNKM